MSTCHRLDLQTLGAQPIILPKNNPDHWSCDFTCAPGTFSIAMKFSFDIKPNCKITYI